MNVYHPLGEQRTLQKHLSNKRAVTCSVFFFNEFIYFIYLLLAVLGLRCCVQAGGGLLFTVVQASHCDGFSCCRAWALGTRASVVAACGLSGCGSWALEYRLSSCGART